MGCRAVAALEDHRVSSLPASFYYIPNFITESEEARLIEKARLWITARPWVQLSRRRLQVYPTQLTAKNVLLSNQTVPAWLSEPIFSRFDDLNVFQESLHRAPNHVLVNEYRPGQGIMPHEDGDAYSPITATVSLGAATVLDLYDKKDNGEREEKPRWRILQEARSLLVTRGDAYRALLHGIAEVELDIDLGPGTVCNWDRLGDPESFAGGELKRQDRISLTCRDVLKVSKFGGMLLQKR